MIGKFLIYIALISSLISVIGFFGAHLGKEKYLKAGRLFYHISSITIVAASFFLLYIILTHQFQYTYVWQQSNRDLQLPLLISTFFAGQEGSFMLWTFMTAVIGVFLLNFVSKGKRLEPQVMTIFTLVLGFLSLILKVFLNKKLKKYNPKISSPGSINSLKRLKVVNMKVKGREDEKDIQAEFPE